MKSTFKTSKKRKFWETTILIASGLFLGYLAISMVADTGFGWTFCHDYIDSYGSILGGIGATISLYYLYWSLREQREQFLRQNFETKFFELINFNRKILENIKIDTIENNVKTCKTGNEAIAFVRRQVDKAYDLVSMVIGNYTDVNYSNANKTDKDIRLWNRTNYKDRTTINIAMLCVFYGVKKDGEKILKEKYLAEYNESLYLPIIKRLKLCLSSNPDQEPPKDDRTMSRNLSNQDKYFAGIHQQLGNYFRSLFQCVKYVDEQTFLTYDDKYSYIKMLRCQMTNEEEVLFFYNSLCDLGLEWEYNHKKDYNRCWITKYNLIKNIPDGSVKVFPQQYYPFVDFEWLIVPPKERLGLVKMYK